VLGGCAVAVKLAKASGERVGVCVGAGMTAITGVGATMVGCDGRNSQIAAINKINIPAATTTAPTTTVAEILFLRTKSREKRLFMQAFSKAII
jgi:hypothetical protein